MVREIKRELRDDCYNCHNLYGWVLQPHCKAGEPLGRENTERCKKYLPISKRKEINMSYIKRYLEDEVTKLAAKHNKDWCYVMDLANELIEAGELEIFDFSKLEAKLKD